MADDVSVCSSRAENERMASEEQWKCLVPTIKVWRDELRQLRVSQFESINQLGIIYFTAVNKDIQKPFCMDYFHSRNKADWVGWKYRNIQVKQ